MKKSNSFNSTDYGNVFGGDTKPIATMKLVDCCTINSDGMEEEWNDELCDEFLTAPSTSHSTSPSTSPDQDDSFNYMPVSEINSVLNGTASVARRSRFVDSPVNHVSTSPSNRPRQRMRFTVNREATTPKVNHDLSSDLVLANSESANADNDMDTVFATDARSFIKRYKESYKDLEKQSKRSSKKRSLHKAQYRAMLRMELVIAHEKFTRENVIRSFDTTGKKINGTFGSKIISGGNKIPKSSPTVMIHLLWIALEMPLTYNFELADEPMRNGSGSDSNAYPVVCTEFVLWLRKKGWSSKQVMRKEWHHRSNTI